MKVHVLVCVSQGVPESVQVFEDKQDADQAEVQAKADYGIQSGAEEESENAVELYYNVPIV
jgi:hypothetical protein